MTDLTDIVAAAVDDATTGADPTPTTDTTPAEPAIAVDSTTEPEPAAPVDEVEAELAANGLKPPMEGQRENRIPYARVQKIVANARKKLTEAHQAELKAQTERLTPLEQKARQFDGLLQLAATSPRGTIEILAKQYPAFGEFLREKVAEAAPAQAAKPATTDPKPEPDAQFPDGSRGYSPEQHDKLLDWHERRAEERASTAIRAEYDKRFGPIEKEWQGRKQFEALLPGVAAQRKAIDETWGKDFIKEHEAEIVAASRANPNVPMERVVAAVLVPKLRADRTTIRGEVLKEVNARPAAAARSAPASTTAAVTTGGARTVEDIVRESVAAFR